LRREKRRGVSALG